METAGQLIYQICYHHLVLFAMFNITAMLMALIFYCATGRYWFFVMTFAWFIVNTIVLIWLWDHIEIPSPLQLSFTLDHVLFWIKVNLSLDVFYVIMGWSLLILGGKIIPRNFMLHDFGFAIVLQGFGLLVLDLIFYTNTVKMYNILDLSRRCIQIGKMRNFYLYHYSR